MVDKKKKSNFYNLSNQLIKVILDPAIEFDTEIFIYYLKSKFKKNGKKRRI